ncbi:MAG: efflux RND transporter periplasmic adaptor subunit [Gammaproteobacteria bacterium]|nr:efflux RND transporter periplasmic adaptor subunit [Gammaproteobacteria bacterium]MBU2185380.1 efflux RND transporter periplasmic adaptor subunit [Gammaproteobacteria bacterium]MBU2207074.1 efflux RND transporter periplasmic adaptor subunit [Gammaproteobacteria bacterium]
MKKLPVLMLLATGAAIAWWQLKPNAAIAVSTTAVSRGTVAMLVANTRAGTVRACQRSKLSLTSGGTVAALHVQNGDRVTQGQLLMSMWDQDQQARLLQAEAQLDVATLSKAERCDASERAAREAKRAQSLAKQKLLSDEALDQALTNAELSRHSCQRAAAEISVAKAQRALQQALLSQTQLLAPFAGVVAEINGEVGEFVTPSPPGIPTPPAVDLIDDSCLYVRAPIDEVDAAGIRVGMPVNITLDAYRGRQFAGTVSRIAPYVQDYEKQARTVDVEARFSQLPDDVLLLIGYSADIEIVLEQKNDTLRLPTEAIFSQNQVLVISKDMRLEQRSINTGISNWRWTEISSGLAEGEQVLLSLDTPGAVAGATVTVTKTANHD